MKLILVFLFVILVRPVFAQQNYFNVPSFVLTPKDKVFFQEQLNVFDSIESNTTIDYGLGNGFEVGFNVYGLKSTNLFTKHALQDDRDNKFRQMGLLNVMKSFQLDRHQSLAFGMQMGLRISKNHISRFTGQAYAGYNYHVRNKYRVTVGPWFANSVYTKDTDSLGLQGGLEYTLIDDTVYIVADSLSGKSPMSVTVLGFMLEFIKNWPLSFGYQIPNNKAGGQAFVLELTYNPPSTR